MQRESLQPNLYFTAGSVYNKPSWLNVNEGFEN